MKALYREWIDANVPNHRLHYGKCKEVCGMMLESFPELTLVRGHYLCTIWGEREHWWLEDSDGRIIDPTSGQFPTQGRCEYVAWNEENAEPTGRCMNCGSYCYDSGNVCSSACYVAISATFGEYKRSVL